MFPARSRATELQLWPFRKPLSVSKNHINKHGSMKFELHVCSRQTRFPLTGFPETYLRESFRLTETNLLCRKDFSKRLPGNW